MKRKFKYINSLHFYKGICIGLYVTVQNNPFTKERESETLVISLPFLYYSFTVKVHE